VALDAEPTLDEKYGVEAAIDSLLQNLELLLRLFLLEALRTLQELENEGAALKEALRSTGAETPDAAAPRERSLNGPAGEARPKPLQPAK
jgi:hypothetical protein